MERDILNSRSLTPKQASRNALAVGFIGTGIGLAIVKSVVDKHGGTTWVEGEENKDFYGRCLEFPAPDR